MRTRGPSAPRYVRGGVVIAGGGTAGHVLPGLAVANELSKRGWDKDEITFIGSARGIEKEMIPAAGYALWALAGRGLNGRRLSLPNLWNLVTICWGMLRGVYLTARLRPSIVLSLGGYAALPGATGAVLLRIPLVLAEQNAAASTVNRLLTRFAEAAAVPSRGTGLRNEIVTGNPVRESVIRAHELGRQSRGDLGWPLHDPVVVVFGGSLGSLRINQALWQAAHTSELPLIHHVVGHRDWNQVPEGLPDTIKVLEYDDELPKAIAAADLVVCRPGGSTTAELALLGVPAVLVPLPNAPNNHQLRNAEHLVDAGLATIVEDAEFDGARFNKEMNQMLERFKGSVDPDLERRRRSVGRPDATQKVVDLVLKHSSKEPPIADPKDEEH
ncbi:MAG: hypothetical protein CL460_00505 [Acidimicrobiaceae bacterium]|nr:hypothetical protein [Acidimicrobiaceae bacterium]|tara:strand:+ start:347 stop:1501 length:1155 start_codon:yes stop_codon:yes gene_type:complete